MSTDTLPVLYSFRRCPYAMRARLAIAASQQSCELREVVLRNKPQAMLDVSPKATVPVLVADGLVIDESLDIMLWALRRHDPQHLLGADGTDSADSVLAAMLDLIGQCDSAFKGHLDRYKYPQRYDLASGVADRNAAAQWLLHALEARLSGGYLFGSSLMLADLAIAPFVRQYAHTDKAWFDAQPWPALSAWLDGFLNNPLFEQVMAKYPAWEQGAQGVLFP
ncbi:MAG: glutathione S-transferase [Burkholderiaceae bacterium]|nr:glutathione S-transferase [Burkholderiaceae bacterium]